MYGDYFGLTDLPFSIAPDPRFLYFSRQHREALAHLQYGLNCPGGFVLLTGEVGTGKTTVCRCLLEQVPEQTDLAFVLSPGGTAIQLLAAICQELNIPQPAQPDVRRLTDAIYHHLLESHAQRRHTVLIIDEAQALSVELLEQIRLLTNLETNTDKLLQIILLGQPELAEKLARPELRQLAQRITARYHLVPLSFDEMRAYIAHRLSVAGIEAQLFQPASLRRLYRLTGGIPRLINVICDRALLGAFVQRLQRVDTTTLNRAAMEVQGSPTRTFQPRTPVPIMAIGLLVMAAALPLVGWQYRHQVSHFVMSLESSVPASEQSSTPVLPAAEQPPAPAVSAAETLQPSASPTAGASEQLDTQWPEIDTKLSQVMAYQQLFELWQLDYDPARQPVVCRYARSQQLDCTIQESNLATLKAQNHPVVFRLDRPGHTPMYATLTAINDEQATLVLGGHTIQLPMEQLEAWWPDSYVMLWQPPPRYQGPMHIGSRGEAVAWLETHLAEWRNRPLRPAQSYYDAQLNADVRAFQRSKGLNPDGIFGPQTGIYFSGTLLSGLPRLSD